MLQAKIQVLGGCELFADLDERAIARLADICLTRKFRKGEVIFLQDQPAEAFFVVQSGSVKIHRINAKGKEQILHRFGRFDVFAEVAAMDGQPFPATATALEAATVLRVDTHDFKQLLARAPEVSTAIIATLCKRLRAMSKLAADLTLKEVDARLAQYLFDQADRQEVDTSKPFSVTLPTTKADVAAQIGTVNETLSRTLAKLAKGGILTVTGNAIKILDPEALGQRCEGDLS